ncbi:MAG: flagellar biosynthetic protein FliO [Armatimonadota bacterium]
MRVIVMLALGGLLLASPLCATPAADDRQKDTAPTAPSTVTSTTDAPLMIFKDGENNSAPTPESSIVWNSGATDKSSAKIPQHALPWQIVKTVLNLALVLAVAYLALLAVQKYYQGRLPGLPASLLGGNRPRRVMRIIESIPLGPTRHVHLVSVGDRCFLLATSAQQLSLLTEITGDPVVEEAVKHLHAPQAGCRADGLRDTAADGSDTNPQTSALIDQFARVLATKMAPSRERR